MHRAPVYICVLVLALPVMSAARSGVSDVIKHRSISLLGHLQQRLGVLPAAKTLLQRAGMAVALCTTLACSSTTQSPQLLTTANSVPSQDVSSLIHTEVIGEGFLAMEGITYTSISAYQENHQVLPVQFYDGMLVHYIEEGADYARVLDLTTNDELLLRHVEQRHQKEVELDTIRGVMITAHPDYGGRYVTFPTQQARPFNDNGDLAGEAALLLTMLPPQSMFYGEPVTVFSDGSYVISIDGYSDGDTVADFSGPVYFMVDSEHLITIERPMWFAPKRNEKEPSPSSPPVDGSILASRSAR